MSINAGTRAQVIVVGTVVFSREFRRKADNSLLGVNLNLETPGGPLRVTVWDSTNPLPPTVGEVVVFVAEVVETSGNGADLSYVRPVNAGDLDLIFSTSGLAPAGK